MKIDFTKGYLTKEESNFIRENRTPEPEIVSNCCGASLLNLETEICAQCLEHCEAEIIE